MYRYAGFSMTVDSELELPELPQGHGDPDLTIRLGAIGQNEPAATIDAQILSRDAAKVLIRGGNEIIVDSSPDADPAAVRAVVLGKVMAHLMRQRGYLPLHGSAIAIDGQAVLFLGESGSGKSTTAAAFYASGHSVLADDVCAVRAAGGNVILQRTWSGLRLLDDARRVPGAHAAPSGFQDAKHIFYLNGAASQTPVPVRRLYFLHDENTAPDSAVRSEAVPLFPAVALLNSNARLEPWFDNEDLLRINLERAASIASLVPVHKLFRRRSLERLPALVDFVEQDVRTSGAN